ncbi:MAG: hypothetical protein QOE22_711 [Candidatus Parcubacteria bacterium]|jgi:hypothetical protein|nr:hypothetical protein [Candidatus Parcubacteria bacterium]
MRQGKYQKMGLRIIPTLPLIYLLTAAAPVVAAYQEAGQVPILGGNSSYEGRMSGYRVLIEDFFTPDNDAPGTAVHLVRTDGRVVGSYSYRAGAWQLEGIMFSREREDCDANIVMDPATGAVLRIRNRCPLPFGENEIETARADLDRARREVHRSEYLVQVVFPEQ